MRRVLLIFVLFILQGLNAQEFSYHYVDEIKFLRQDSHGFVYLISNQSVCKFDGKEIHNTCLHLDTQINDAAILSEENYFIASGNNFLVFENQKKTQEITLDEIITSLEVFENNVIIGTSGLGLYRYSLKTKDLSKIDTKGFINDLTVFENSIYAITDSQINKVNEQFEIVKTVNLPELLSKRIITFDKNKLAILMDDGQILFINSNLDIVSTYKPKGFKPHDIIGKNGMLYAINENHLMQWGNNDFQLLKNGEFKNLIQVQSLLFTTNKNTIESFNIMSKFHDIKGIYSLYADKDNVWLGREGKISLFSKGNIVQEMGFPEQYNKSYVSSLVKYKNKIYAGTMGMGILVFDSQKGEFLNTFQKMESKSNEQNIIKLQISDDQLWVGYLNGLKVFDLKTQNLLYDYTDLLENNYLYTFHARNPDDFFLGTSDDGFVHVKNGDPNYYFKDYSVYAIVDTPNGIIFSVEEKGVFMLNENITTNLSENNFLRSENIYNILYNNKKVLFAHDLGVDVLDLETNQISYLSNENLTEPHLNANAHSGSNCIIAYENGIYTLQTQLLEELQDDNLVLSPPLLFDEEVRAGQSNFSYKENVWSFLFESLNYNSPTERYYKYRLIPLEKEWKTTTQEKTTYYNLPPGKYNFEVSNGGHRNFIPSQLKSFKFKISKPFWMLPWFWLLMFFGLLISVYLVIKYRENQIIKKEQLKNAQIQYEYQRMKDQINPHFLFNSFNSLIGIVEENPKQAVTVLEKLSAMFRTVLKYEKAEIISLQEELEMALQYFEIHKIRYQDLISIKINNIDNTKGKFVIPMSLQLLIENAIKHNIINTQNRLEIVISESNGYLEFSNNINKKNEKALSLGLGLDNLTKRNELILKKKPVIVEKDGFFTVKIPYIYE